MKEDINKMKRTVFLLSHSPIPRFVKRIKISIQVSKTYLVYWDRNLEEDIHFSLPNETHINKISLPARQGQGVKKLFKVMRFLPKALLELKKIKPDTIHAGNLDMLFIAVIYKKIFNKKTNLIYEIGDIPNAVFNKSLLSNTLRYFEKKLLKDTKIIILTSPYFYSGYYNEIVDEEKVLVIPNVPSKKILEGYNDLITNKEKNSKFVVGFIGAVRYKKEIISLINVANKLDFNVQISGVGIDYKPLLQKYSHNKKVSFTGAYNYNEIQSLYVNVDLIYSVYDVSKPNVKLALPNRLYEAILFEKPIVVANGTKLAEFVKEKDIGFIVDSNIEKGIENIYKNIQKNHEVYRRKVNNCKKIKQNYFYESYLHTVKELYE